MRNKEVIMTNKRSLRLLGILLTLLFVTTFASQAFAAARFTPAQTQARLETDYTTMIESLDEFLLTDNFDESNERIAEYVGVLKSFYAEANGDLDRFATAAPMQTKDSAFDVKSEIFYSEDALVAYKYGFFRWVDERVYSKIRAAFNVPTGRFYVNYSINPNSKKLLCKASEFNREYWIKNRCVCCNNTKKDHEHFVNAIDVVPGANFIFAQYAFLSGSSNKARVYNYEVYRIMIGAGRVYMSKVVMTESELKANRVKSPYESWDAFRKTSSERFEFTGKTLRVVTNGKEAIYRGATAEAAAVEE